MKCPVKFLIVLLEVINNKKKINQGKALPGQAHRIPGG
jgi:hypothetical protein